MAEGSSTPSAQFIRELRRALHHLYEPARLQKSPLFDLFGISRQRGASALQDALLEAIQQLKPDATIPRRAKPWRTYNTLLHLHVQQFSQAEVATTLAISTRQLRRQERLALQVLVDLLWARCRLHEKASGDWATLESEMAPSDEGDTPSREEELAWLERSVPTEPADIGPLLLAIVKTVAPLARTLGVDTECHLPGDLPRVAVQVATIRQGLLNTLTAAIRSVPGGRVTIEGTAQGRQARISVRPMRRGTTPEIPPADQLESLEMARQLATLSGGSLEVMPGQAGEALFTACLLLPAAEQMAVLVIDDNADTLQLCQRYLAGSRYPFIGTRDPHQALALAEDLTPQIVVLDVMLPGVDGWELLGRLREHPRTRGVPIIVCTILPEEKLALALGAAAFLRKPVNRRALLSALDRQADLLLRGP